LVTIKRWASGGGDDREEEMGGMTPQKGTLGAKKLWGKVGSHIDG